MTPALARFIAAARTTLAADNGPAGQEQVRVALEPLLTDAPFFADHCGSEHALGSHRLYEDPDYGFTVIVYIGHSGRGESPLHDHGPDWAVYGQVTLQTDMRDWRITAGAPGEDATVEAIRAYALTPGQAHLYAVGDIHSIRPADACRYIRVAGSPADHFTPVGPVSEDKRRIWGPAFTRRVQAFRLDA